MAMQGKARHDMAWIAWAAAIAKPQHKNKTRLQGTASTTH
jgi:hypothetical protein